MVNFVLCKFHLKKVYKEGISLEDTGLWSKILVILYCFSPIRLTKGFIQNL